MGIPSPTYGHHVGDVAVWLDDKKENSKLHRWVKESKELEDIDMVGFIGNYAFVKNQTPIKRECYYIRGICTNRFPENAFAIKSDFMTLMDEYIAALAEHYSEDDILEDLVTQVKPKAKSLRSWYGFENLIGDWIKSINSWPKTSDKHTREIKEEYYETFAFHDYDDVDGAVEVLKHLYLEIFGKDKELGWRWIAARIYAGIFCYIYGQRQAFLKEGKVPNGDDSQIRQPILDAINWSDIYYVDPDDCNSPDCSLTFSGIFYISQGLAYSTFEDILSSFNFYQRPLTYESSIKMMAADIAQCLNHLDKLGFVDTSYEALSSILRDEMP